MVFTCRKNIVCFSFLILVTICSAPSILACNQIKQGKYEIAHAYHGTSVTLEQLEDILTESVYDQYPGFNGVGSECGLITTKGGRIGDGVYLATDKNAAETIAYHRWKQRPKTGKIVLEYFINLPKGWKYKACECNPLAPNVNDNKHCYSIASDGVDLVKAWHPPWVGETVFREICTKNPAHLVLRSVYIGNEYNLNPRLLKEYLHDSKLKVDDGGNITITDMQRIKPIAPRENEMKKLYNWWKDLWLKHPSGGYVFLF